MKWSDLGIIYSIVFVSALENTQEAINVQDGAKEVKISDYPYQVSVRFNNQHFCGGSIIDANNVLTSRECVHNMDPIQYSVNVGSTKHKSGLSVKVSCVIENDDYDDIDIAMLKLSSPLNFSSSVQPIALQGPEDEVLVGTTATVSGWGVIFEGSLTISSNLKAVDAKVLSTSECASKYRSENMISNMMCAQALRHDISKQDFGAPLVANGKLIGVYSWGIENSSPLYPGVYTKVSDMYSWIINARKSNCT